MDKINNYRSIIKQILSQHAEYMLSYGEVETIPTFDERSDSYLLLDIGWGKTGRVYSVPLHLRIKQDKIWVERDNTDAGIAEELLDAGVEKEDIVLGFYRPERRKITEFAVA
ncbi:MAG: XisI protein [Chloroflexota bacterium]